MMNLFPLSSFKQFLELEPQLREVLQQFYQSRYTSCLKTLQEMRETFMLDLYLSSHLNTLYTMIRNKALIQVGLKVEPLAVDFPYSRVQYRRYPKEPNHI